MRKALSAMLACCLTVALIGCAGGRDDYVINGDVPERYHPFIRGIVYKAGGGYAEAGQENSGFAAYTAEADRLWFVVHTPLQFDRSRPSDYILRNVRREYLDTLVGAVVTLDAPNRPASVVACVDFQTHTWAYTQQTEYRWDPVTKTTEPVEVTKRVPADFWRYRYAAYMSLTDDVYEVAKYELADL